jgi:transposase-like protein
MAYENYWRSLKPAAFDKFNLWRKTAKTLSLSKAALNRLEWIIFYQTKAQSKASIAARHFGINSSTFYKWLKLFNEANLRTLETRSKRPRRLRSRQARSTSDERIILLRKQYPYFGKMKLKVLYEKTYGEKITSWYVQRVIETYQLYFKKRKKHYTQRKTSQIKKRITECETKPQAGFMLHLDSIVLHLLGTKRYIITAIDDYSKVAYARMYKNHSSGPAKDFFHRLRFLLEGKVDNVHTDNGSEFHKHFEQALNQARLTHWWSRPRTPKDNPSNERFNQTLKHEFLNWGNFYPDPKVFNQKLTDWLIEYNSIRPHQSLNYLTPLEFAEKTMHLSTMWSSSTLA